MRDSEIEQERSQHTQFPGGLVGKSPEKPKVFPWVRCTDVRAAPDARGAELLGVIAKVVVTVALYNRHDIL